MYACNSKCTTLLKFRPCFSASRETCLWRLWSRRIVVGCLGISLLYINCITKAIHHLPGNYGLFPICAQFFEHALRHAFPWQSLQMMVACSHTAQAICTVPGSPQCGQIPYTLDGRRLRSTAVRLSKTKHSPSKVPSGYCSMYARMPPSS